jgi:hypothetical protein
MEYPPAPPIHPEDAELSGPTGDDSDEAREARRGFSVPYAAPELPPLPDGLDDPTLPANRPRARLRERP